MKKLLMTAAVLLVAASPVLAGEYYTKEKANEARGEASEGMALVYVFRPATVGAAIKTWAFADDQFLGVSRSKGYFFAEVPAGTHIFWAKAENTSGVEVEVQEGETYYFKMAIRMGIGKARVQMMQVDEAEAERYFGKCDYVVPTEEGRQRAAEIAANREDRAVANAEKKKAKGKSEE